MIASVGICQRSRRLHEPPGRLRALGESSRQIIKDSMKGKPIYEHHQARGFAETFPGSGGGSKRCETFGYRRVLVIIGFLNRCCKLAVSHGEREEPDGKP
jgi:hypothetical protein